MRLPSVPSAPGSARACRRRVFARVRGCRLAGRPCCTHCRDPEAGVRCRSRNACAPVHPGGNPDSNTLISDTTTVLCLDDVRAAARPSGQAAAPFGTRALSAASGRLRPRPRWLALTLRIPCVRLPLCACRMLLAPTVPQARPVRPLPAPRACAPARRTSRSRADVAPSRLLPPLGERSNGRKVAKITGACHARAARTPVAQQSSDAPLPRCLSTPLAALHPDAQLFGAFTRPPRPRPAPPPLQQPDAR